MKVAGWKTASMFRRYDIVDTEDIADAMDKFQAREDRLREQADDKSYFGHSQPDSGPKTTSETVQ